MEFSSLASSCSFKDSLMVTEHSIFMPLKLLRTFQPALSSDASEWGARGVLEDPTPSAGVEELPKAQKGWGEKNPALKLN